MEGVSLPARNCILHVSLKALNIYCIFPYTQQQPYLASLKPTRLLLLNPKQWNISNPYITYVSCVCAFVSKCNICKLVPKPEKKNTSKSMELETIRVQNKFQVDWF